MTTRDDDFFAQCEQWYGMGPSPFFKPMHPPNTYLVAVQNVAKRITKRLRNSTALRDDRGESGTPRTNHVLACPIQGGLGLGLVVVGLQVFFGVDVSDTAVAAVSGIVFFVRLVLLRGLVVVVVYGLVEGRGGSCCGGGSTGGGRRNDARADLVA